MAWWVFAEVRRARLFLTLEIAFVFVVASSSSSGCKDSTLPPYGEALVIVDTDVPVPLLASRLRVDIYGEDGRWNETRDVPRFDHADWPVSFSVYTDDEARGRRVYVRLRAYPDGYVRDYRGERSIDDGAIPEGEGPKLVSASGVDTTPSREPLPSLTIDRIVLLDLAPGRRGRARIVLRGDCMGTAANLEAHESCVATEKEREAATAEPIEEGNLSRGEASTTIGTWGVSSCSPADSTEDKICVPGGAAIVGSPDLLPTQYTSLLPLRGIRLPRRALDKTEVTVARFRAAMQRGFVPPVLPDANESAQLTFPKEPGSCTWSTKPQGREELPVTCLTWETARAFCKFEGGDLPSEAFWEYTASTAGRSANTDYPWGDAPAPTCKLTAVDRVAQGLCRGEGLGPTPVGTLPGDVTLLGVRDMGGNVAEYTLDAFFEDPSACWKKLSNTDPVCASTSSAGGANSKHVVRGGSYEGIARYTQAALRNFSGSSESALSRAYVGIRCAYDR